MDKLTIDFEKSQVHIETENKQSVEYVPNLKALRDEIYAVMGYKQVDFSAEIDLFNKFINGEVSMNEVTEHIEKIRIEEEKQQTKSTHE